MYFESSLGSKALDAIRRSRMLEGGEKVVVSVSGGPDSTALLLFLRDIAPEFSLELLVFHLDHMFRGEESAADAEFVRDICERLDLEAKIESVDVPGIIEGERVSAQVAARRARLSLLHGFAEQSGADRIAIGHTADDQVETFLMRVIQGAGVTGLGGIRKVSGKVIRPLLGVWKEEVEDYLSMKGLQARMDSSNRDVKYLRNRVRLKLLPLLTEEFGPGIKEVILREVECIAADREFLDDRVEEAFSRVAVSLGDEVRLDASGVLELPEALRRGVLRKAWNTLLPAEANITWNHVMEISEKVLAGSTGAGVELPRGVSVEREYGEVVFRRTGAEEDFFPVSLEAPGELELAGTGLTLSVKRVGSGEVEFTEDPRVEYVRGDLEFPLLIRPPAEGDRFHPLGSPGSRKLSDFFTDVKLPRRERRRCPLVFSGGEIVWVAGHRLDERFKVSTGREGAFRMEVLPDNPSG